MNGQGALSSMCCGRVTSRFLLGRRAYSSSSLMCTVSMVQHFFNNGGPALIRPNGRLKLSHSLPQSIRRISMIKKQYETLTISVEQR